MKIVLLNGSPKLHGSTSGLLLAELQQYLQKSAVQVICMHREKPETVDQLVAADCLVFACPLYVDALPSHLLRCLEVLEPVLRQNGQSRNVYGIVNSGFFEAQQNRLALRLLQNWCVRAHQKWGGGIGVGGGGMIPSIQAVPVGRGSRKSISLALRTLAHHIETAREAPDIFVSPNFPRSLYRLAAQAGWRQQLRKNGRKASDIGRRLWP